MINDYELIYLVHDHQDGVALEYLFKKYERLIWKYIHQYRVESRNHDDYFQEGIIALNNCINLFDESRGKTFTRYFELILKRRILRLKSLEPDYYLYEKPDFLKGVSYIAEEVDDFKLPKLDGFELEVYQRHYGKGQKIKEIALKLDVTDKKIYNALFRIKQKIKKVNDVD